MCTFMSTERMSTKMTTDLIVQNFKRHNQKHGCVAYYIIQVCFRVGQNERKSYRDLYLVRAGGEIHKDVGTIEYLRHSV